MKKCLYVGIALLFLLADCFLPLAASSKDDHVSKITHKLLDALDDLAYEDEIKIYAVINDVDRETIMESFANDYPEEFDAYMLAEESNDDPVNIVSLYNEPDELIEPQSAYEEVDIVLLQRAIQIKRSLFAETYYNANKEFVNDHVGLEKQLFISRYSPMVIVLANQVIIDQLCKDERTCLLDLVEEYEPIDYLAVANTCTNAAYVRDVFGNKGNNVAIGMIESGIPYAGTSFQNSIHIYSDDNSPVNVSSHATMVANIIAGIYEGVAPQSTLYAARLLSYAEDFYTRMEWLVDRVNIINMSCGFGGSGAYNMYAKWIDHIANEHDVHVVVAAGSSNDIGQGLVNNFGMAYNAITVGGYNDNNTVTASDDAMSLYSPYMESSNAIHGEKPNLIAPSDNITVPYQGTESGTSFSAPQVSGVIAQLCSYKSTLLNKQSVVGAMLAAGSVSKISGFSSNLINGSTQINDKQGAGKLDARKTRAIAYHGNYWRATIQPSGFPYSKTISITADPDSKIRIAIFWLARNSLHSSSGNLTVVPLTNLDLKVYAPDGSLLRSSTTLYSNYEIVQFTPTQTGNYTIKIVKITSGTTNSEKVGIAVW